MSGSPEPRRAVLDAFRQGLRDLGYVEGKNIAIEYHLAREGMSASQNLQQNWSN
jgi:hypothetical protein